MINLTIVSLSLSSSYIHSPLFVGNRNYIMKSNFNFYSSTIFYNFDSLFLEKCSFSHGIGNAIFTENNSKKLIKIDEETTELNFTNDNYKQIMKDDTNGVVIIRDCRFLNIFENNYESLIKISSKATVYMTGLIFYKCNVKNSILNMDCKATTLTHICCSELRCDQTTQGAFLYTDPSTGSFFKFIYSSLFGDNQLMDGERKITNFRSSASYKLQCLNISNFDIKPSWNPENNYIIFFDQPSCFSMLMCTFQNIRTVGTLYIYDNNAIPNRKSLFIGQCNFLMNIFDKGCLCYKFSGSRSVCVVTDCVFTGDQFYTQDQYIVSIEGILEKHLIHINCSFSTNPKINVLAHYVVDGYCYGEANVNAYGCKNDTCPDFGCEPDAFKFPEGGLSYTEKYYTDINPPTPSPSVGFSLSNVFTYSSYFSKTNSFSESSGFTYSKSFSKSSGFTKTEFFSKSSFFTKSFDFSSSVDFTGSNNFTKSIDFTKSEIFNNTLAFSNSNAFSETGKFSKTSVFTNSGLFSKSDAFSDSKGFLQTENFSNSQYFTKTGYFSETAGFTKTLIFSASNNFTKSNDFIATLAFTKSNAFSETGKFGKTSNFTNSGLFSKSDAFSDSKEFTQTTNFSYSHYFTKTDYFSKTNYFSKTSYFSETTGFTKTLIFSESKDFTKSFAFTKSSSFCPTEDFNHSHHFTKSNVFSKSFCFTKSNNFNPSLIFSNSNTFTQTNQFTKTNEFTISSYFSDSNYFTKSKTLKPRSQVVIDIKYDKSHTISPGIKIMIGLIAGVAGIGLVVAAVLFFRKRKYTPIEDFNEETFEINNNTSNSILSQNPLMSLMNDDDPFEDEFDV